MKTKINMIKIKFRIDHESLSVFCMTDKQVIMKSFLPFEIEFRT